MLCYVQVFVYYIRSYLSRLIFSIIISLNFVSHCLGSPQLLAGVYCIFCTRSIFLLCIFPLSSLFSPRGGIIFSTFNCVLLLKQFAEDIQVMKTWNFRYSTQRHHQQILLYVILHFFYAMYIIYTSLDYYFLILCILKSNAYL